MAPSKSSKASSASAGAKRRSSSTSTATSSKAKTGSTLNSSFTASKASATLNAKKSGVTKVKEEVGSSSKTSPSSMTMTMTTGTTGTTKELEEAKALQEEEEKKLIKSYGKLIRESSRIMGTAIHDQDWLPLEVVLRVFDADPDYGPCSNQSRLERFERAERLGLEPPSEIGAILRSKVGLARPEYRNSVFSV